MEQLIGHTAETKTQLMHSSAADLHSATTTGEGSRGGGGGWCQISAPVDKERHTLRTHGRLPDLYARVEL